MRIFFSIALFLGMASAAGAQTTPLNTELSGIGFLVGTWGNSDGKVAETGGTARGSSTITAEAGGSALLRRDHTDLFGADGKPSGSFDIIMLIYPQGGTLHADYADGQHVINYTSAVVVPGKSVVFMTATTPGAPTFRLRYELTGPMTLAILFEIAPAGQTSFHPIASGTLFKSS